eukprot:2451873-Prymnesium_polylepis.1
MTVAALGVAGVLDGKLSKQTPCLRQCPPIPKGRIARVLDRGLHRLWHVRQQALRQRPCGMSEERLVRHSRWFVFAAGLEALHHT